MFRKRVNTKKNAGFLFPVPLAALLSTAALLCFGYLWLNGRCESLAQDIKRLEESRAEVRRRVLNEEYKWSNLCTLRRVREALVQFQIPMDWPDNARVVHLSRPLDAAEIEPASRTQVAQTRPPARRK